MYVHAKYSSLRGASLSSSRVESVKRCTRQTKGRTRPSPERLEEAARNAVHRVPEMVGHASHAEHRVLIKHGGQEWQLRGFAVAAGPTDPNSPLRKKAKTEDQVQIKKGRGTGRTHV